MPEIKYDRKELDKARNKAKIIYEWVKTDTIDYATFDYLINTRLKDDAIYKFMCRNPGLGERG